MTCTETPAPSAAPTPGSTAAAATPASLGFMRVSRTVASHGIRWNVCALLPRPTGVMLPIVSTTRQSTKETDTDGGEA